MIREDDLQNMHDKLKAEQDRLTPYLTLSRMCELLNYSSTGALRHVLNKMVVRGLAERVEFGDQYRYRLL